MFFDSRRSPVLAKNGMVATSQPLAAVAGLRVMMEGGNAVDAAVATAASTAFPPCIIIRSPATAARGWLVATIPFLARTAERRESKNMTAAPEGILGLSLA